MTQPNQTSLAEQSKVFAGLVESVRLRILDFLFAQQEPITTSMIAASLDLRPSQTSHHLRRLEESGLVLSLRSGGSVIYGLNRNAFAKLATTFASYSTSFGGATNESL